VATYLIDGTTPIPENGDTNWGTTLNAAINAIDGRFTYQSASSIPATKALASGVVGTTLASNVLFSSLTSLGTLTALAVSGNVVITGDLTINGTTTTINTTTLNISDNVIVLNNDVTGSPTENAAIEIERGTSTNVQIRWNETDDRWEYTNDGSTYAVFNAAASITGTTLASNVVSSSLTSVGTISSGTWNGGVVAGQYGGTGVANTGKTITLGGNLETSGAYNLTLTLGATTSLTLPSSGTLATLAGSESLTNKKLGSLTSNGIVTTSGGDGTLSVTSTTGSGDAVLATSPALTTPSVATSITTASASFALVNTGATTVNFAGAATTLSIGAASGTTTVNNSLVVTGDLTVNGTTTTVNATTISVDDKNIELGSVSSPSDVTADGGGVTLRGTTDKTLNWVSSTAAWTSSEDFNLLSGKVYEINGTTVLSATGLGSNVVSSSLTSVGTISSGTWNGGVVAGQYGGTGVANTGKTITVSGNTTIGSSTHTVDFTTSGNTSVALPATGTLATLAGSESLTNKKLGSLTSNGIVTTSNSDGTLSVTSTTGSGSVVLDTSPNLTTSLTTGSTTFALVNTTATTINFAGAATALSIGASSGTTTINNGLTVSGTTVLGPASIVAQSSSYTLATSDAGKVVEMTNSTDAVLTVPPNNTVPIAIGTQITVVRNSTGKVQFAAGAGVTILSDSSKLFLAVQYAAGTLIKRDTNVWYLIGNLAAS